MTDPDPVMMLRVDQGERWRRGERVPVEAYLERRPALRDDTEGLLDLIYNEVVLREAAGDRPELDEYLARFPHLGPQLRAQFEVHRALEGGGFSDDTPGVGVDASSPPDRPARPFAPESLRVAGYEIVGELGRGGMGAVYLARQVALKRLVALKMILAGAHAGPKDLARFRTEAEAVARLRHPNVVQIYEVLEDDDGRPCLAMEWVDGGNLAQSLAGTPRSPREAARLLEVLARAVHDVHRHDIVHRDLKPGNVLLTKEGIPKITDFGLAKLLDGDSGQTPSEAFLGTPSYMAPEQATGHSRAIGPLSDVYALGAILYELLTGRPPFRADTPLDTILQVASMEPVPPARLQPTVPRDLNTICLKCLEKEPGRRYADAGELADDLARFLAGESIRGRPTAAWRRALKWARRRPAAAALVAVGLAAALTAVVVGLRHEATERRRLADLRAAVQDLVFRAQVASSRGDWSEARVQLSKATTRIGSEPALGELRSQAGRLLAEVQGRMDAEAARLRARARRESFDHWRDEALFLGTRPVDLDAEANLRKTEAAVRTALGFAGMPPDPESTAPDRDPSFNEDDRQTIVAGCYELLLVLADALARPSARDGHDAQQRRVARSLRILDRAPSFGQPTRAHALRKARDLAILGDRPAAEAERARAATLPASGAIDSFLLGIDSFLGEGPGELAAATGHFADALSLRPDHFWSRYYLAACYLSSGRPDLAEAHLTACLGQRPDSLWVYLLRGFARGKLRAYPLAEADFLKASQLGPDAEARYALLVNRGSVRLERGRLEDAAADLEEALAVKPDGYRVRVNLALLSKARGRLAEAAEQLDRAAALGPPPAELASLRVERTHLLLLARDYRGAVEACDAVLAIRPDDAEAHGVRARALLELGDFAGADRAFTRCLELGGGPALDVHRGRGQARMRLGNYLGAVDDYSRALEIESGAEIRAHRGWAYFFADAPRLALRDFDESIRDDPKGGDAHVGRGLARAVLGQYREAASDAEASLRLGSAPPEMRHNVACVFAQAADRAEADRKHPDSASLAALYRERATDAIRATLDAVPEADRPAFWRDKISTDDFLDPVRRTPGFLELEARYSRPTRGQKADADPPPIRQTRPKDRVGPPT